MILVVVVGLAAVTVPVLGGRLSRLHLLRPRWLPALGAALGIQILIISVLQSDLAVAAARALHLGSYALAGAFLYANRRIPWLWLIGVGGAANVIAIAANGGVMPASRTALAAAGRLRSATPTPRPGAPRAFVNSAYHAGEHLRFLGDMFDIPRGLPFANVFSIGDVAVVVGALLLLHTVCGSRVATLLGRHARERSSNPVGADDARLLPQ